MSAAAVMPVLYILFLAGTVVLVYAVYGQWYGEKDTKLTFSLDDAVCFNPEFHHDFVKRQIARLPVQAATNRPESMVQLTKIHLADRMLNVAIPSGPMRFQSQDADEEICVASVHDVTLERVGHVPYVYGLDVAISAADTLTSRMIVSRGDMVLNARSIVANGLLASGDVEVVSNETQLTRIAGFSYRFNGRTLPHAVQQAFKYRRYNADAASRIAYVELAEIQPNSIITENIVCARDLEIGGNTTIHGAVKVYGSIRLSGPVIFLGPVVVNADFDAPEGCVFMSNVVIKGRITADRYLVAGQPQRHSVCVIARQLNLKGALIGCGTLVASEQECLRHAA
jgi:hypothetical protein